VIKFPHDFRPPKAIDTGTRAVRLRMRRHRRCTYGRGDWRGTTAHVRYSGDCHHNDNHFGIRSLLGRRKEESLVATRSPARLPAPTLVVDALAFHHPARRRFAWAGSHQCCQPQISVWTARKLRFRLLANCVSPARVGEHAQRVPPELRHLPPVSVTELAIRCSHLTTSSIREYHSIPFS
jgi:hypothetical protein